MIPEGQAVAKVFNKFFINIVPNLKIRTNYNHDTDFLVSNDQVANALNKFRNHPSIVMIKNKRKTDQCFSFGPVTCDDILKKINNLDTAKVFEQSDIPTKILKQISDYFAGCFCGNINQCISKSVFLPDLKLADVTPVYENKSSVDNSGAFGVLFIDLSKAFFHELLIAKLDAYGFDKRL